MNALEIFVCPGCHQERYGYEKSARTNFCKPCQTQKASQWKKKRNGSQPGLAPDYRSFSLKKVPRA